MAELNVDGDIARKRCEIALNFFGLFSRDPLGKLKKTRAKIFFEVRYGVQKLIGETFTIIKLAVMRNEVGKLRAELKIRIGPCLPF